MTYWKMRKFALDSIQRFGEETVRLRTVDYKGYGRPKKSDYAVMKRKDVPDFLCREIFMSGTSTHYIT